MKAITDALVKICTQISANFYLNGSFISYGEIFKDNGMLPAIAKQADQLSTLCLGYGIGISFEENPESIIGKKVIFDDVTPNSIRILFLFDVIQDLIQSGPSRDYTPLDELMYA